MKSPWTKKNPWMSMYLSGANAIAGSIRGRAASAAKRQTSTAVTTGIKQLANMWTSALSVPSPRKGKGRRR